MKSFEKKLVEWSKKFVKSAFQSKHTLSNQNQDKGFSSKVREVLSHLKEVNKLVKVELELKVKVLEGETYLILQVNEVLIVN